MGLNIWGYLILAAETFCFWDKTNQALYFRISVVIQCLIKADRKMTLNREQYPGIYTIYCERIENFSR